MAKTFTAAELAVILDAHKLWLLGDKGGARANLARANLAGANLADATLAGANLADANLAGANLADATLADANLAGAYLAEATLAGATLADANLAGANLADATLAGATLAGANLADANLAGANLAGANLADAYLPPTSIVPEEGEFIAFKKLRNDIVATLTIPAEAKRVGGLAGRKCRASSAVVVALSSGDVGYSMHDARFAYRVGETVTPDAFNDDIRVECGAGIHFFITRKEAEAYIGY